MTISRSEDSPVRMAISARCLLPSISTDSTSGARKARSTNWRVKGLPASEKSEALWICIRSGRGKETWISLGPETGTSARCPFRGTAGLVRRLDGFVAKAIEAPDKLSSGAVRREERGDVFTRGYYVSGRLFCWGFFGFLTDDGRTE